MAPHDPNTNDPGESGERPRITPSSSRSKFRTGAKVYWDEPESRSLSGPYLIASVRGSGRYTLCYENGDSFRDGEEFEEDKLVKAD